jgi:hypothetical protein
MTDAQASEAARELARARWGTRGLDRAVETLRERRGELTEGLRAEMRELIGAPEDGTEDGT